MIPTSSLHLPPEAQIRETKKVILPVSDGIPDTQNLSDEQTVVHVSKFWGNLLHSHSNFNRRKAKESVVG